MIADEDVRSEPAVGYYAADGIDFPQIILAGILPVHVVQHLIRAALGREVDVMAKVRLVGNGVENILRHVLRVRSGEPHPHIGNGLGHGAEQIGERA